MIEAEFLASLIAASMRAGTPLLFATLGEIVAERSGVLNLGLEGVMVSGAMTGFYVSLVTGNPWLGVLAGGIAGLLLALIHAFFTVTLKVDQAVTGLMLVLLGLGLTGFLGRDLVGQVATYIQPVNILFLSSLPYGNAIFNHDPVVYVGILLVPLLWFLMNKTRYGMELFAVGENPEAADTMGIPVDRVRFLAVLIGGFLAGIGGAHLSLAYAKVWTDGLTAGRGWICLALVIFSGWMPQRAIFGAYLFGGLDVLSFKLQAVGLGVSYHFMRMIPYIFTILVLLFSVIREREKFGAPSALGKPYIREQKF
ncbi:ABC transporter permease [Archaeoglobales archaeon]|nr:MAG: ABC transporter permease [Archaeoglobales archaeon]